MDKLEKVIKGLECCNNRYDCKQCPYATEYDPNLDCIDKTRADAIELLKAQHPKVLIMEDVPKYDVVWMETDKDEIFPALVNGATGDTKSKLHYFIHLYGVDGYIEGYPVFLYNRTWRCWSSRPTNNVRMNTPWKDGEQG